MFARTALRQAGPSAQIARGVRFNSTLPIPPKIATPKSASGPGGSSARMESVVGFYKSLPKGDAPQKRGGGIKARYFDGKNASGKPIVATLFTMFLIGYSIDYAQHLRKYCHQPLPIAFSSSTVPLQQSKHSVNRITIPAKSNRRPDTPFTTALPPVDRSHPSRLLRHTDSHPLPLAPPSTTGHHKNNHH